MKVTATQINEWATTIVDRGELPRLVRRLIHEIGTPSQVAFPAGDSTNLPGWDGQLVIEQGNSWVPKGKSYWEFSCEVNITKKANEDYFKRTKQTNDEERLNSTLVIVTARRWSQKSQWKLTKKDEGKWANLFAYDADDLEQWMEQCPAVMLQFAEELGLAGPGVESLKRYWDRWSNQSKPPISNEAFFVDRENSYQHFITDIRQRLENGQGTFYSIRADSIEEAIAFACACLIKYPDLDANSLVVNELNGWRFVEQNSSLKIVIAAQPDVAENAINRNNLLTIVPYATGDIVGYYRGSIGSLNNNNLILERPNIYEFKKALINIGLEESDATRLASRTGRSWSIFRRHCALNPAIQSPNWLNSSQARALSTLCLLGGWTGGMASDREIVAYLSGRIYEEVERDLRYLSRQDDSPVLEIGEIWKAKSPLELLDLYGSQITRDELDRFFNIAQQVLITPDPGLELPDEKRYASSIYGKERPYSEILIKAICDTLIKLSVNGVQIPSLLVADIDSRIASFVRNLLIDADWTRWLSLSSFLPCLAEAAPNAFLYAIEVSLAKPDTPVICLLTETNNSGLFGSRCWHADLLWALETLAWAPELLSRVVFILARLTHVEIKGNWGNSPRETLTDIFRSWLPQTAANLEQRIQMLDQLIAREPDIAFELLDRLINIGHDTATPTARPKWREYDAGVGRGVSRTEQMRMLIAAADRLITISKGNAQRLARLIEKFDTFDDERVRKSLALIDQCINSNMSDDDKEVIRAALRKIIHWHRNYDKIQGEELDKNLQPIEDLYEKFLPNNLIVRHHWLFTNGWVELPARERDDYRAHGKLLEDLRIKALKEVYTSKGFLGIEEFILACPNQLFIGYGLTKLGFGIDQLADWTTEKWNDPSWHNSLRLTINGLLTMLESVTSKELIINVLERCKKYNWDNECIANFLALGRFERVTWEIVASCNTEIENIYWEIVNPGFIFKDYNIVEVEYVIRRLLKAGRPRTTMNFCQFNLKNINTILLTEILEQILQQDELNGPKLDSWHIGEAINHLEKSENVERSHLISLEFALIPLLGYDGEQRAELLCEAIMTEPRLFTELICILYKPENRDREVSSQPSEWAVDSAWHLLHQCSRLPGTRQDGTIDHDVFLKFIKETRELCKEEDRLTVCDITLGMILAHSPPDSDGVWPFKPARDVLEYPDHEEMRNGFQTGIFNKRGTFWRSLDEGGTQERKLAEQYDNYARILGNSYPNLSTVLQAIARGYEREGRREDLEARLRKESY